MAAILLKDPAASAIMNWLDTNLCAPAISDFGWGEVVAAVGRRVRMKTVRERAATRLVADALGGTRLWERFEMVPDDIAVATGFVARFELGLRLPDALHLAVARRIDATLLTTDRQQGDAAAALGIAFADPTRLPKEPR